MRGLKSSRPLSDVSCYLIDNSLTISNRLDRCCWFPSRPAVPQGGVERRNSATPTGLLQGVRENGMQWRIGGGCKSFCFTAPVACPRFRRRLVLCALRRRGRQRDARNSLRCPHLLRCQKADCEHARPSAGFVPVPGKTRRRYLSQARGCRTGRTGHLPSGTRA